MNPKPASFMKQKSTRRWTLNTLEISSYSRQGSSSSCSDASETRIGSRGYSGQSGPHELFEARYLGLAIRPVHSEDNVFLGKE